MNVAALQRCVYHPAREAVARCPSCRRFFCRECISEHEDRVLCAHCLAANAAPRRNVRRRFSFVLRMVGAVAGVAVAWLFFDLVARVLIALPAAVHQGTVWQAEDS